MARLLPERAQSSDAPTAQGVSLQHAVRGVAERLQGQSAVSLTAFSVVSKHPHPLRFFQTVPAFPDKLRALVSLQAQSFTLCGCRASASQAQPFTLGVRQVFTPQAQSSALGVRQVFVPQAQSSALGVRQVLLPWVQPRRAAQPWQLR